LTTELGAELADALPPALLAVTVATSVELKSAEVRL
jgi:hypothetical protein